MIYKNFNNCLTFLPASSKNKKWDFIQEIKDSFEKLQKNDDFWFQEKVVQLLLEKCEGENPLWGMEEYTIFQNVFRRMEESKMAMSKQTILCLLQTDEDKILEELNRIAELVDFYPAVHRTYIKEEKKYDIYPEKIQMMDCYRLLTMLCSNMLSFVYQQAESLHLEGKDFEFLYQTILEVDQNGTNEEQESYLEGFNQAFSYVRTSFLYHSLYENFKHRYFTILLNRVVWIEKQKQQRNYRDNKIEYLEYKKQTLFNREVINRSKSSRKLH